MDKASEAAAMAGWAQNPNAPVHERLSAAYQALNFYVDCADKLADLLVEIDDQARDTGPAGATAESIADRIRKILDGTA